MAADDVVYTIRLCVTGAMALDKHGVELARFGDYDLAKAGMMRVIHMGENTFNFDASGNPVE